LKEEYINGAAFTMDGNPVMLQEVKRMPVPATEKETSKKAGVKTITNGKGKVLPFKTNLK
jgi:hypothetical protein